MNSNNDFKVSDKVCPIPPKKKKIEEADSNLHEIMKEYNLLMGRVKQIRGILYKHGVDPEKYK